MNEGPFSCARPSKEMVRAWLAQRRLRAEAPPEPAEIRKALNWTMTWTMSAAQGKAPGGRQGGR